MANIRSGNSFYIDSASSGTAPASFVVLKSVQIASISFTSHSAGDSFTICDLNPATQSSAGSAKITVSNISATDTKFINFHENPMQFPNGIWVSAISANCTAALVLITQGS